MRDVTKLPLRPFGKGAGAAADAMDAAGPAVGMVGDAVVDSFAPVLGEIGSALGTAGVNAGASALSAIPGVGPALSGAASALGTTAAQVAPRAAAAGAQLAMQAPKIAGRAAYGLASGGLRMMESDLGASKYGPAMSKALSQRAAMSIGGPSKPGGGMGSGAPPMSGGAQGPMSGAPMAAPQMMSLDGPDANKLYSDALQKFTQSYTPPGPQPRGFGGNNPGPFSETQPDPQDPRRFRPAGRRSAPF